MAFGHSVEMGAELGRGSICDQVSFEKTIDPYPQTARRAFGQIWISVKDVRSKDRYNLFLKLMAA